MGAMTDVESVIAVILEPTSILTGAPSLTVDARAIAVRLNFARFNMTVLGPLPLVSFSAQHKMSELVHFTRAMRDSAERLRETCGESDPVELTTG